MEKEKITNKEGVFTICDGKGNLISIVRRDPISKKHLVYLCSEATSDDIVEKLIKTDFSVKIKDEEQKKD